MEQYTDGHLLSEFSKGSRLAIQKICKNSADRLARGDLTDADILHLLRLALAKIGDGESPNDAFGWTQTTRGNMPDNLVFRDWNVRLVVRELLREGMKLTEACGLVSSEQKGEKRLGYVLGFTTIAGICRGLTRETQIDTPESIFPISEPNKA